MLTVFQWFSWIDFIILHFSFALYFLLLDERNFLFSLETFSYSSNNIDPINVYFYFRLRYLKSNWMATSVEWRNLTRLIKTKILQRYIQFGWTCAENYWLQFKNFAKRNGAIECIQIDVISQANRRKKGNKIREQILRNESELTGGRLT